MVSLLIVSHSRQLAEGVKEFVGQATNGQVTIIAAGGRDDGGLGTSVDLIIAGLHQAATPDGTLVLVDLMGAVLAVEMALEMTPDVRAQISNAPLVEGAYLAGVEASTGIPLEAVAQAALQARELVKLHQ
ncbi:MAG: PTS-dependent dihydroxyacetone kinase phosphotransferase subunit DhaM [Roseiflexaceae bacterium]|nr:PTS-dependent dihydroxyacetone kinase phosphotransferase subunit DhaM [Roseiflexaceae bacterium]